MNGYLQITIESVQFKTYTYLINIMSDSELKKVLVRDIMTKKVISVSPETPIIDAAKIITEHNFVGLPVVDGENHLLGILTEYDLITKTSGLNVSFLQKIISDLYPKDKTPPSDGGKSITELTVKDVMNPEPLTLRESAAFDDIIETFKAHHRVNPIPIVNEENKVVGIISRFDILRPLNIVGYSRRK